jgi:chromate transporter
MSAADLWALFSHFMLLSLLSVGGAITTVPDIQRFMVGEHHWLDARQFTNAVAIAQAAPGPNVLFVGVMGWMAGGPAGLFAGLVGMMLPSSTLALVASRWSRERRHTRGVQAFHQGMAPVSIGLLAATSWVLGTPTRGVPAAEALYVLTLLVMSRSRISPLWLLSAGALLGATGWL